MFDDFRKNSGDSWKRGRNRKVKASLAQAVKKLTHSELTNSERPVLVPYNLQLTSMKLLWIYVNRAHRIYALFRTNYGETILIPLCIRELIE